MKAAVLVFPGSNCDRDMAVAIQHVMGVAPIMVWHGDHTIPDVDFIAVPGGFSYGDYLRAGAIAGKSPIIDSLKQHALKGTPILGVCNGFQILTETGLLPGALRRNKEGRFICKSVLLKVQNTETLFTKQVPASVRIPIAHHDGNYCIDTDGLQQLQDQQQIAFLYADNPNGSTADIAGIFNQRKTILGMMPHPERAVDADLPYGTDGKTIFKSLLDQLNS